LGGGGALHRRRRSVGGGREGERERMGVVRELGMGWCRSRAPDLGRARRHRGTPAPPPTSPARQVGG
jgi:hypothetical protein